MSKISLTPNASGTGTFTITSPNSNTNRTLTLPDAGGVLLTADGDGSSLTGINTSPPTTTGAVGTYAWLVHTTINTLVTEGSTYAGSILRYTAVTPEGLTNWYGPNYHWPETRGAPAGTWRAMGGATSMYGGRHCNTLFVRIS